MKLCWSKNVWNLENQDSGAAFSRDTHSNKFHSIKYHQVVQANLLRVYGGHDISKSEKLPLFTLQGLDSFPDKAHQPTSSQNNQTMENGNCIMP